MGILGALSNPSQFLAMIAALVVGLSVHECAHAWMALRLGDDTAASYGRLTLDPRKHIDPLGALVFLMVGFGWAKPVPVDGYRIGRRGMLQVGLAGPASNLLLATAAAVVLRLAVLSGVTAGSVSGIAQSFLGTFMFLNLALAVFNLLPIAPLDGWNVLLGVVPQDTAERLDGVSRYGSMVLMALLLFGVVGQRNILGTIIWTPVQWLAGLLLGRSVG